MRKNESALEARTSNLACQNFSQVAKNCPVASVNSTATPASDVAALNPQNELDLVPSLD